MIQDIGPDRLYNTWEAKKPDADSRIMAFHGNEICVMNGGRIEFPTLGTLTAWYGPDWKKLPEPVYLFSLARDKSADRTDYYLAELPLKYDSLRTGAPGSAGIRGKASCASRPAPPDGCGYVRMSALRTRQPKAQVFAAATAWHLYQWYRDNRHCGRCGGPLLHDTRLRMLSCPSCGSTVFPKIAPAVIVGLTDGDRILMTKYADREYQRHALIAGFTEIGETAEETVAREVLEEVGLRVKNIRYYKSQPWGFDSNLLLGFFCELDGSPEIRLDEEELSVAEWIDYRDISEDTEGISLTRDMMTCFKERRSREKP